MKIINKKILLLLLIMFIFICVNNCNFFKTELKQYEGSIHLSIKENFIEYMFYDEIPSYDLILPVGKKINTTLRKTGENEVIFTHNDDFIISDMLENLFNEYKQKNRFSIRSLGEEKESETHLNKIVIDSKGNEKSEKVYMKVDNGIMYNEIACMTLENGLQLTINYRRFSYTKDEISKTYYSWQYTESVRAILYYPLMIVKNNDGTKRILIVALPNAVINKIETRYDPKGLLENDDFLDESYYTYEYADYNKTNSSSYDNSLYVENMKNYYIDNFNGHYEGDTFVYSYLGYKFSIEFLETKFIMRYIEN